MKIRPALPDDIPVLAAIWAEAFPGERTTQDRVRQLEAGGVYGGIETAWIAEDDGTAVGGFRTYSLQQHILGARVPMMGLAAVAVRPNARRQGLGSELCRVALRHARERGDIVSMLYPFRPSFYDALGYSLTGVFHSYRFRPDSLPVTHTSPRVTALDSAAAFVDIADCYSRAAPSSNGLIERTSRVWRQHMEWPDVHAYTLMRGESCDGYVIVHQDNPTADHRGASALTVRELIAVDEDAYRELLSWIALQHERCPVVHYDARPDERFDLRLTEPRTPGLPAARVLFAPVATILRGPMGRVVNVEEALRARVAWPDGNIDCKIVVRDDQLPENTLPLHVSIEGGCAHVRRVDDVARPASNTMETDIRTFTQIYLGEVTVHEAVRLGRAAVTGSERGLCTAFTAERPFCILDEF